MQEKERENLCIEGDKFVFEAVLHSGLEFVERVL